MPPACHPPTWLRFAPRDVARCSSAACRGVRLTILLAVLFGQIGLPNLAQMFAVTPDADSAEAVRSTPACGCAPSLRRVGRCCCTKPPETVARSCCAGKKTAAPACRRASPADVETKESRLAGIQDGCPCDGQDHPMVLRCVDPRFVVTANSVPRHALSADRCGLIDDLSCGDAFPPPLPPPKSLVVG